MEYSIITSEHFQPVSWSGGTATELFIFPKTANYHLRNFQFRLSTATIETDKSDFTTLKGISRKLMVLSGVITINHENHYSRKLGRFETDEFNGGWKTSSAGRCTDFNLMTTGNTTGEVEAFLIEKEQVINCNIKESSDWVFVYVFSGKVRIDINHKISILSKGDLLILNNLAISNIEIKGIENSELVFPQIAL
jgi:environmental stress-induced protein Ves